MYASEEWIVSAISMFAFEGTVLGHTKNLVDSAYQNMIGCLVRSDCDKEKQIRMLASWGLPNTLSSIRFADQAILDAKLALQYLQDGRLLPTRPYDGMVAKAIQSLRYHNDYSFTQFVNPPIS